jgi:hypothetical protein
MRTLAQLVSAAALVGTIAPSLLLFAGVVSLEQVKWWMLVATIAWFVATPVWMDRRDGKGDAA